MDSSINHELLRPDEQRALEIPLKPHAKALQQLGRLAQLAGWPLDSPQVTELAGRIRDTPDKHAAEELRRELKAARKALEALGITLPEFTNDHSVITAPEEMQSTAEECPSTPTETLHLAALAAAAKIATKHTPAKPAEPTIATAPAPRHQPQPERRTSGSIPRHLCHLFRGSLDLNDIPSVIAFTDEQRQYFMEQIGDVFRDNVQKKPYDFDTAIRRIQAALEGKDPQGIADETDASKAAINQFFYMSVPTILGRSPQRVHQAYTEALGLPAASNVKALSETASHTTMPEPSGSKSEPTAEPHIERSIDEEPTYVQLAHRWHKFFIDEAENEQQRNGIPSEEAFKSFFNPDKRCDMTPTKQQIVDRFRQLIIDHSTEEYRVDIPDEHHSSLHKLLGFGVNTASRRFHYSRPQTLYAIAHAQHTKADTVEKVHKAFTWLLEQQMPQTTSEASPQTDKEQWLAKAEKSVRSFGEKTTLTEDQITALWQRAHIDSIDIGGHRAYTTATKTALDKVVAQIGRLNLFDDSSTDRQPFLDFFLTFSGQPSSLDQLQAKYFAGQAPDAAERFIIGMIEAITQRVERGASN